MTNHIKKKSDDFEIRIPNFFLDQFYEIEENVILDEHEKLLAYHQLFSQLLEEATIAENLNFPTLFSRLAYIGLQYKLSSSFLYYAHSFRRSVHEEHIPTQFRISLGKYVIFHILKYTCAECEGLPTLNLDKKTKIHFTRTKEETIGFQTNIEALMIDVDQDKFLVSYIDEKEGDTIRVAKFNVADRNELFNQNLLSVSKHVKLPVPVNFIDSEVAKDGTIIPRALVLQPDLLVDVTSIAECFKETGSHSIFYLLNKFRDNTNKTPILLGNIVNLLLEELIQNPEVELHFLTGRIFSKFGLNLALLSDDDMAVLWNKIEAHFINLKHVVKTDFPKMGIHKESSFLESSFYSRKYGIQGRLDLFVHDLTTKTFAIIELKSGSPYRPNVYGISVSHFIQTQIYEMLIQSVFEGKIEYIQNYILYSREREKSLRFAPSIKPQHWEVLKVRNDIIIMEELMKTLPENSKILQYIKPENLHYVSGFMMDSIQKFANVYHTLTSVEIKYFHHYLSFIAKEYSIAKIGVHGIDNSQGHAALWLESTQEKENRFAILTSLKIEKNESRNEDPRIVFAITKESRVSNFRKGDIAIIYPVLEPSTSVLFSQVYKCSILEITDTYVEVKLRNKQNNQTYFNEKYTWRLEEDLIDSSFHKLYESVFTFLKSDTFYRSQFLGIVAPVEPTEFKKIENEDGLTNQQHDLVEKALNASDFFLIWGPPGTGKTNVVLKRMIKELFYHSNEEILLLAYTNRAVDEICKSMTEIAVDFANHFVRIGAKASTQPEFVENLLDVNIQHFNKRHQILQFIQEKRIIVSTVSSILGKPELFEIKKFDTIIIDEASQILEPLLCGLLNKSKRKILIGDHKQLPAVVRQDTKFTFIEDKELTDLGFQDTSYSLFDRMFQQYKNNNWNHAFGILTQQGRMHHQLQSFVDRFFYENNLKTLSVIPRLTSDYFLKTEDKKKKYLEDRKIFINTPTQITGASKINIYESAVTVAILKDIQEVLKKQNLPLFDQTIGIITPFRAQIAQIKKDVQYHLPEIASLITVDTVERYQGGARDIIIFSICANNTEQLKRITSKNQNGIDRKLNVSLTRAKEQIIMVGNKNLLVTQDLYQCWIQESQQYNMEDICVYPPHEMTTENSTPESLTHTL